MIRIRPAVAEDSDILFSWRNDPQTRAASISTRPITRDEHDTWFADVLSGGQSTLYLAELGSPDERVATIGMVRFDRADDPTAAEVSINLNPDHRGLGLSRSVLRSAIQAFDAESADPFTLVAVIRTDNVASVRIFEAVGFVRVSDEGDLAHFRRDPA